MLLDTSAIVAVILREAGWESLGHRIDEAAAITVSSASLLETHLVLTGRPGTDALPLIDAFLSGTKAEVVPFTEARWRLAAAGFLRFGKGRHPAALNLGDCFTYGAAQATQQALLFCGKDFSRTDVSPAI
jgi:ribonuclease VapC